MIFKQVREIITGQKTQTRRIRKDKPREVFCEGMLSIPHAVGIMENHTIKRIKWKVGHKYAVQPGRGKSQVYYRDTFQNGVELAHETWDGRGYRETWLEDAKDAEANHPSWNSWQEYLTYFEWKPLYIKLTDIRGEDLHDIDDYDAKAEGVASVDEYRKLWIDINGQKSWDANPEVWVLEFQAVTS